MDEAIKARFEHHNISPSQQESIDLIRKVAISFADDICFHCREGRERSLALTKLEEVLFWANAGISRERQEL